MKILLAKSAGFCFGVRRAVNLAEKAAQAGGSCFSLGPLIHNRQVTGRLEQMGVREVQDTGALPPGATVIIRSHGASREDYAALEQLGAQVVDATCPDVAKIHELVRQADQEGRLPLIIGAPDHPEVLAICGWCSCSRVFADGETLAQALAADKTLREAPLTVVFQTTLSAALTETCKKILKKLCTNCKIFDTMCNATSRRQEEAREIAGKCDAMVVIGDKASANSIRLAEICQTRCPKVLFIETAAALSPGDLDGVDTVGVTAGASTPAWIIKEVIDRMNDEIKNIELEQTGAVEAEKTETAEQAESFEEMLEKSIKTLYTGEKVTGIVAAITPTEISVDLGTKQSGYIPMAELSDDPTVDVNDIVQVGNEIETYVVRVNDVEGTVMLSKKRLDMVKNWDDVEAAKESGEVMEGIVTEENKGGVVASVKGVRVFIPASQTGIPKGQPLTPLLKTRVRLRITDVNRSRRRVVGSIRAVQGEERRAAAEKIWNEIEVGKQYHGVVKSLTSYGAFVDIGGIDGMVHVSELSWNRIKHPSEVVNPGDEVDVYVISFDKENRKISLGHKDPNQNPWKVFTDSYSVGSVANVKIVKLMDFGAFAEIVPGVDGLIHISQIADHRIGKPGDVLSEGVYVDAKITAIDEEKHKVSLSIRALLEQPVDEADGE